MGDKVSIMATALRWAGLLGILAIAVARCTISFAPLVVFDFDPVTDPTPFNGLGPAGSLWLDVLLLASCGIALLGEGLAARRPDWTLLILAAIPIPAVIWHGLRDAGDLWRGSTWAAAALASAVLAQLVRDRAMRAAASAALLAVVAPLLLRGALQTWFEHPLNVQLYHEKKAEFLRDRGWEEDSPQVRTFEERLRHAEPTGWFVTTNVYGSAMSGLLMAWLGVTAAGVVLVRRRPDAPSRGEARPVETPTGTIGGNIIAGGLATTGAAWAVAATRSKGAILVTLAGLGLLAFVGARALMRRAWSSTTRGDSSESRLSRLAPWLIPLGVVLVLASVIARGTLLPEDFAGDKSLLFRWHYLAASARIIGANWLAGVGADGFQAAYLGARLPRNPEEVASAHSVFVDWLATLGVSGVGWIALIGLLAWRAGRRCEGAWESNEFRPARTRPGVIVGSLFLVGAVALGGATFIEASSLDAVMMFMRVLGIAAYIALGVAAARLILLAEDRAPAARTIQCGLLAACGVVVLHGQIEMTFVQPGAVVWCMCLVALAGGGRIRASASEHEAASRAVRWEGVGAAAVTLAGAASWAAYGAIPAAAQQAKMIEAAGALISPVPDPAGQSIQRERAATLLRDAYAARRPPNVLVIDEVIRQLVRAAELAPGERRREMLTAAADLADEAAGEHGRSSTISLAAGLFWRLAQMTSEARHYDRALDWARRATDANPHSPAAWRQLADILWDAGRRSDAADAYGHALRCHANFALDPLKQFSEKQRAQIERRIEDGRGAAPKSLESPLSEKRSSR